MAGRRFDDPAIQHGGSVKQAMNAAVTQILTAAGFTVAENPNDMAPHRAATTTCSWRVPVLVGRGGLCRAADK